jgi:DNA-binding GntR family transcriptional regulator
MASVKRGRKAQDLTAERASANGPSNGGLLKEHAYRELKQRILSGALAPGSFLAERQLAGELGMSKTPVRAALERLELEGYITVSPQQGILVRDLSFHDIADQYEIRAALETYVLRTLAGQLTAAQLELLRENLRVQEVNARDGDVDRAVQLDADFHFLFCKFLGNQEILRVMGHLRDKMRRLITRVFTINPGRILTSYQEHLGIADAVIQGDALLAVQRIEDHLQYGKQCLLSPRHG